MGGRERNSDSTLQTFITGINTPSAEGETAFFSPRLPPLFSFARIPTWRSVALDTYATLFTTQPSMSVTGTQPLLLTLLRKEMKANTTMSHFLMPPKS